MLVDSVYCECPVLSALSEWTVSDNWHWPETKKYIHTNNTEIEINLSKTSHIMSVHVNYII